MGGEGDNSTSLVANISITVIVVVIFCIYFRIKPFQVPSTVPGPTRYPLIGFLWYPLLHWDRWPTVTMRLANQYGRTWGGPIPNLGSLPGAYFYLFEEDNIKHILKDKFDDIYVKSNIWKRVLGELLGDGIFTQDGIQWRVHRKVISNMFTRNLLRTVSQVTVSNLNQVVDIFEKNLNNDDVSSSSSTSKLFVIDIQDLFFRLTIDVTAKFTFDFDLDSIHSKEQHQFAIAFDELSSLCQKRFLDPLFEVKRYLQITERERRITELTAIVDEFCFSIIKNKRRSAEDGSPLGPDLLSLFMEKATTIAATNSSTVGNGGDEIVLTDKILRDIIMNIMLAGRDTTACALSWMFFELSRNPHVVKKVVDEINSSCGIGDDANYSYDIISNLRYTHAVALESLRIHPPVPLDPRYAIKSDILPDGTNIMKGSGLTLLFQTMGLSRKIWGDDVLEFKPERFLVADDNNNTITIREPSQYQYPMFNAGPRLCLGKPLALMTMKLVLAVLLPKFNFNDEFQHTGEYEWSLVQRMKHGFKVRISPRYE